MPLSDCVVPDNARPQLLGLSLSSHRVDVRRRPYTLTLHADVVDRGGPGPASGLSSVLIYLAHARVDGRRPGLRGVSLSAQPDGSWAAPIRFRPGAAAGRWFVLLGTVSDKVGFTQRYSHEALAQLGLVRRFRVLGPRDRADPRIHSVEVSRTSLRLRPGHTGSVRVRVRASDDLFVKRVSVDADSTFPTSTFAHSPNLRRVGSGLWAGRITFPAWNSRGRYRLDVWADDGAGNFVALGGGWSYSDGPIPGPDSIVVSGGRRDRRHPVVRIITAPTSPIDLRSSDQTTTVRARIRDAKSGVQDAVLHGDHGLKIPLHRVSGTRYDGVWEARAVLSHCIKVRRTSLNITAHDAAGHSGSASHPVQALVSDHKSPWWTIFTGSPTGPLRWEWTEDVVGISNESAAVGYFKSQAVGHFEHHVRIPVPGYVELPAGRRQPGRLRGRAGPGIHLHADNHPCSRTSLSRRRSTRQAYSPSPTLPATQRTGSTGPSPAPRPGVR